MSTSTTEQANSYGSITISDNASAFLGNDYSTTYHINEAVLTLGNDDQLRELLKACMSERNIHTIDTPQAARHAPLLRDLSSGQRGVSGARADCLSKSTVSDQHRGQTRPRLLNSGIGLRQLLSNAVAHSTINHDDAGHAAHRCEGSPASLTHTWPTLAHNTAADVQSRATGNIERPSPAAASLDLLQLALPTALLVVLACRSTSVDELCHILSKIQHDPLFPALTAVVGWCLRTFFVRSALQRGPSQFTGDCMMFEDVYRIQRSVPAAYLADPEILEGFFRSHYRGSSAQRYIEEKQYTLMIRGRYVTLTEFCAYPHPCGGRLAMAVMLRAYSYSCPRCTNLLEDNYADAFECTSCGRIYRAFGGSDVPPRFNTSIYLQPSWSVSNSDAPLSTDMADILDIDLDFRHKQQTYPSEARSTPPLISALKRPDIVHFSIGGKSWILEFPPFSIAEEEVRVRDVRWRVARILDLQGQENRVKLLYRERYLERDETPIRIYGCKYNSVIKVVVPKK